MIEWCNLNNGFIQAVLVTVYVIATIAICVASIKSSCASRRQLEYQRKHDEEVNRARVVPSLRVLEGSLIGLCFTNIGHEMGTNLKITISKEWLDLYRQLSINVETIERFMDSVKRIEDNPFLPPDRAYEIVLFVCRSTEFSMLDQLPKVEITCSIDSVDSHYDDKYSFYIRPNGSLTLTTDYARFEKKKTDALNKMGITLQRMEKDSRSIVHRIESQLVAEEVETD